MILQCAKSRTVELGVSDDDSVAIDECYAVTKCGTRCVCENVRILNRSPLRANKARLASKLAADFLDYSCVKPAIDDPDDRNNQYRDDGEGIDKKPIGKPQASRLCPALIR